MQQRALEQGMLMSGDSKLSEEDYEELLKPLARELSAMSRLRVPGRSGGHGGTVSAANARGQ